MQINKFIKRNIFILIKILLLLKKFFDCCKINVYILITNSNLFTFLKANLTIIIGFEYFDLMTQCHVHSGA